MATHIDVTSLPPTVRRRRLSLTFRRRHTTLRHSRYTIVTLRRDNSVVTIGLLLHTLELRQNKKNIISNNRRDSIWQNLFFPFLRFIVFVTSAIVIGIAFISFHGIHWLRCRFQEMHWILFLRHLFTFSFILYLHNVVVTLPHTTSHDTPLSPIPTLSHCRHDAISLLLFDWLICHIYSSFQLSIHFP